MAMIRPAQPSEDTELSRVLFNAFLPIWNHNWFQNISQPLASVPIKISELPVSSLTSLQQARIGFYLSLIKATRLLDGEVLVNIVHPTDPSSKDVEYGAILLWLPPHARMSITSISMIYNSGFLRTMYAYGITGIYRINFVFEANIRKMFGAAHVHEHEYNLVQMLASNGAYRGKGLARELLRWKIERTEGDVVLDTSTTQGTRTYERMGFKVLGETEVETRCDALGIRLAKTKQREEDTKCVQRVMMLAKGDYVKSD